MAARIRRRRRWMVMCVLAGVLATSGLHGLEDAALRSALLAGVVEIAAPGIPGPVCLIDAEAVCVVPCRSNGVQAGIVAAGKIGSGRLIAMGHDGYLGAGALKVADTGTLVLNCMRWLGATDAPRVAVLDAEGMAAFLESNGLAVQRGQVGALRQQTPEADVVVLKGQHIRSSAELDCLRSFVQAGGGVLIATTGWGWIQLNPEKTINRDCFANALLADAGLAFSGAMSKRTSERGFDATIEPGPFLSATIALDALMAHDRGERILSQTDLKQTSTMVSQAARAVWFEDTALLPRLEPLLSAENDHIIPTRDRPVRHVDGLDRLIVALNTDRMQRLPASEVTAHPAADDFPGAVAKDAKRVNATVRIDTAVSRWHSTGLYATPGEVVLLRVPEQAAGKGFALRIGAHKDGIWRRADWWRYPEITRTFPVNNTVTRGACAFGGLVYVEVPRDCSLGSIEVALDGAVQAPLYLHGKTNLAEWRDTIRHYPAPWAEIGSDKVIITIPSEHVRNLDDPAELMVFWNGVLDACADLAVRDRTRTSPERYVADRQISAGYMHAGYPIMTFLDAAPRFVDVDLLRNKGDWGMFHEMGHNHQSRDWTFSGTGEVTVNLFSLYILDTCCPEAPIHGAVKPENVRKRIHEHIVENKADFSKWKRNPFTALVMYIQLQQAFGWNAYKKVFAEYRDLPENQKPKSDDEKRDQWLVRMSRTVGHDLSSFFETWGIPTSERARAAVADLPTWMPDNFPPDA